MKPRVQYNKTAGYNAILYTGDTKIGRQGFITYRQVNSIKRFILFAEKKYPAWVWVTLYRRSDNEKRIIKRSEL